MHRNVVFVPPQTPVLSIDDVSCESKAQVNEDLAKTGTTEEKIQGNPREINQGQGLWYDWNEHKKKTHVEPLLLSDEKLGETNQICSQLCKGRLYNMYAKLESRQRQGPQPSTSYSEIAHLFQD